MQQSDSIKNLASALHKAQGEIRHAVKDSANPFFKSKYADLGSVWDAIRPAFQSHGLSVTQIPDIENGQAVLVSILMHESGEWMRGTYPLTPVKNDPQGVGSSISYARRYSLQSIAGVCADDDDGEAAQGRAAPVKAVKVASKTGEVQTKMPPWSNEQSTEAGSIIAEIITFHDGDRIVSDIRKRMRYDQPMDVIDELGKALAQCRADAEAAKG